MSKPGSDYRTKRLLSPESVGLTETLITEKKLRLEDLIARDIDPIRLNMAENEIAPQDLQSWMATISAQLRMTTSKSDLEELATKTDLMKMNDTIVAQGEEIRQIREELQQHKKELDNMRSSFDEAEARNLNRKFQSAHFMGQGSVNNMADRRGNSQTDMQSTRKNLVIEGLKGDTDMDMIADLLRITTEIGAVVYRTDIDSIFRLNRRDSANKTPGPVLFKFNRIPVRDSILKNKFNLCKLENMQTIYINADEPVHVRRTKAVFRKIAVQARNVGEEVELRYNYIKIGMTTYSLDELHKIPARFIPDNEVTSRQRMDTTDATASDQQKTPEIEVCATSKPSVKPGLIRKGEKMRIVEAGLLFSGPTAYPSNMNYATITYDNKDFNCNEQVFQCLKAEVHKHPELAASLKANPNAYAIKVDASQIVTTKEWKAAAPELLWKLFDLKMKQHPELLERLIDTAPLKLIEASTSERWGGGAPFESSLYDTGKFTGKNEFGELATNYRDTKIKERAEKLTS